MLDFALIALVAAAGYFVGATRRRSEIVEARGQEVAQRTVNTKLERALNDSHRSRVRVECELEEAQEEIGLISPGPSLVGKTLTVTDPEQDLTLRGVLHAQHADRWTFRDVVYVTRLGEEPAGGLVHMLTANMGPTQEVTDELAPKLKPVRAAEVS